MPVMSKAKLEPYTVWPRSYQCPRSWDRNNHHGLELLQPCLAARCWMPFDFDTQITQLHLAVINLTNDRVVATSRKSISTLRVSVYTWGRLDRSLCLHLRKARQIWCWSSWSGRTKAREFLIAVLIDQSSQSLHSMLYTASAWLERIATACKPITSLRTQSRSNYSYLSTPTSIKGWLLFFRLFAKVFVSDRKPLFGLQGRGREEAYRTSAL